MKTKFFLFGVILFNFFLLIPSANAESTYSIGITIGSKNTLRVIIVDDILKDTSSDSIRNLPNEYDVGDKFSLEVMSIEKKQEENCLFDGLSSGYNCRTREFWKIGINQRIYPLKYEASINPSFDNNLIIPLPVNKYLANASGNGIEYSNESNIMTVAGYEMVDSFGPMQEWSYDLSTGWLVLWRLKRGDNIIFEMISDTYSNRDALISGYNIPFFLGLIIVFTFDILMRRRKKK